MEEGKKVHKFHGHTGGDSQLWFARTEATLAARDILSVVETDVTGEKDYQETVTAEIPREVVNARAIILQVLGDRPLRLDLPVKKIRFRFGRDSKIVILCLTLQRKCNSRLGLRRCNIGMSQCKTMCALLRGCSIALMLSGVLLQRI